VGGGHQAGRIDRMYMIFSLGLCGPPFGTIQYSLPIDHYLGKELAQVRGHQAGRIGGRLLQVDTFTARRYLTALE
jgi:hypothetical protein